MTVSWKEDLTLAQARLAALQAAELKALTGERIKSVRYQVGGVEYADPVPLGELTRAIYETGVYVRWLGGGCAVGGAIIPVMGG